MNPTSALSGMGHQTAGVVLRGKIDAQPQPRGQAEQVVLSLSFRPTAAAAGGPSHLTWQLRAGLHLDDLGHILVKRDSRSRVVFVRHLGSPP